MFALRLFCTAMMFALQCFCCAIILHGNAFLHHVSALQLLLPCSVFLLCKYFCIAAICIAFILHCNDFAFQVLFALQFFAIFSNDRLAAPTATRLGFGFRFQLPQTMFKQIRKQKKKKKTHTWAHLDGSRDPRLVPLNWPF